LDENVCNNRVIRKVFKKKATELTTMVIRELELNRKFFLTTYHSSFMVHSWGTGSLWLPKDRVTLWITLMQKHLFMASFSIFWF
jgi:hypothetical protein